MTDPIHLKSSPTINLGCTILWVQFRGGVCILEDAWAFTPTQYDTTPYHRTAHHNQIDSQNDRPCTDCSCVWMVNDRVSGGSTHQTCDCNVVKMGCNVKTIRCGTALEINFFHQVLFQFYWKNSPGKLFYKIKSKVLKKMTNHKTVSLMWPHFEKRMGEYLIVVLQVYLLIISMCVHHVVTVEVQWTYYFQDRWCTNHYKK